MLGKLLTFFRGYLLIEIRGNALERFISQIINRGIDLWDVRRIKKDYYRTKIRINDFNKLRPLVKKRLCTVKILQKSGLPFIILKVRRRYFLLFGILFFLTVFWLASSCLWFINIEGLDRIPEERVYNIISELGVRRGVLKEKLDLMTIEQNILQQEPGIIWADVTWQGTRLNIELVEKKIVEKTGSGNIIAARDGVITELIVLKGRAVVKEGDTVTSGQTLIVGLKDQEGNKELARGIVRANVWYKAVGEARLRIREPVFTRREKTIWAIKYGSKTYRLLAKPSFTKYILKTTSKKLPQWRNINLPLEFIIEEYREVEYLEEKRNREVALFIAKQRALDKILNRLKPESVIIGTEIREIETKNDSIVRVSLILKTEEDIGIINNTNLKEGSGD